MKATNPNKIIANPSYKPLSIEQENAIDLLILAKTDQEVANAVGLTRPTIVGWRANPVFMATLNARRQALWQAAHEQLRAALGQAVANITGAVAEGNLKASIELLRILSSHGTVGAPQGQTDPDAMVQADVARQADREGFSTNPMQDMLSSLVENQHPGRQARIDELVAAMRAPYLDDCP